MELQHSKVVDAAFSSAAWPVWPWSRLEIFSSSSRVSPLQPVSYFDRCRFRYCTRLTVMVAPRSSSALRLKTQPGIFLELEWEVAAAAAVVVVEWEGEREREWDRALWHWQAAPRTRRRPQWHGHIRVSSGREKPQRIRGALETITAELPPSFLLKVLRYVVM